MMSKNYVITIGRQLGSGGAITGKAIADHFGFQYIDKEFLVIAAQNMDISAKRLEELDEKEDPYWIGMVYTAMSEIPYLGNNWTVPTSQQLFDEQTKIMEQAVENGPCVIIGRCGSHLFKDYENHTSIFLQADIESRAARLEKTLGKPVDPVKDRKMIEKEDKERAKYYHTYTGKQWTDMNEYDLVLDTSGLSDEQVKDIIISYIENKFPELKK